MTNKHTYTLVYAKSGVTVGLSLEENVADGGH